MKDILLQTVKLLLLAVPFVLLVGIFYVSPQKVDFSDLKAETESAMDLTEMQQADAQLLRRLYGLNGEELSDWILWTAQDNMAVEELLLVECVSKEQAEQVRQAVEARVDTQIHNFEGYGPEQVQLLKESVTEVRDTCVLFVVSEQAQDVKDSFLKLLYPQFFRS